MARRQLAPEAIITILAAAPQRIAELTSGVTAVQLRSAPAEDEWSAVEVLAHLRACSDQWGGCIVRMLDEDHPTIRAVNPRTWIKHTDYREQPFRRSLD